jgi:hypothetical protein
VIDYPKLLEWALAQADGDRAAAVDLVVDAVESAAVDGDTVAIHTRRLAMRRGFRADLNDYCRTHSGRLTVAIVNATIPAGKSVHRREATGRVRQLHINFIDMLFAKIRDKIGELVGQENRLYDNVIAAIRFLELETVCPGARTPKEALERLGVNAQTWLDGARLMRRAAGGTDG